MLKKWTALVDVTLVRIIEAREILDIREIRRSI